MSTVSGRWYGDMSDYVGTDMNPRNATKGNDTLDKNAFLNILVAQLQNQDPLSPMDNGEMVNQLTQFTTIEQLQQQTAATTQNQAYSMIGKYASAQMRDSAGRVTEGYVYGRVESTFKQNGETWLTIGGYSVKLDDVYEVYDQVSIGGDAGNIANATAVIGKYVVTENPVLDDNGKITGYETVEGIVKSVVVKDGITLVRIGDREISFIRITQIFDSEPESDEVTGDAGEDVEVAETGEADSEEASSEETEAGDTAAGESGE